MALVSPLANAYVGGYPGHTSGLQTSVDRVVIHATVSSTVRGGARAVAGYFQSPDSGGLAHYICDPAEIICCAQENVVCWHAPPNANSIGIELCDPSSGNPARWGDGDHLAMLALGARLTADVCARWSVPLVYVGAAALLAGRHGVTGHVDVAQAWHQSNHTDPGAGFPWATFMAMVTSAATPGGHAVPPSINPPMALSAPIVDWHLNPGYPAGLLLLTQDGAVYTLGAATYHGGANGQPWFAGRQASAFGALTDAETKAGKAYVIIASTGERYALPI